MDELKTDILSYFYECQLGNLRTTSYLVRKRNKTLFNSTKDFFDTLVPREAFKSKRFMELLLDFSTDMSDHHAVEPRSGTID